MFSRVRCSVLGAILLLKVFLLYSSSLLPSLCLFCLTWASLSSAVLTGFHLLLSVFFCYSFPGPQPAYWTPARVTSFVVLFRANRLVIFSAVSLPLTSALLNSPWFTCCLGAEKLHSALLQKCGGKENVKCMFGLFLTWKKEALLNFIFQCSHSNYENLLIKFTIEYIWIYSNIDI